MYLSFLEVGTMSRIRSNWYLPQLLVLFSWFLWRGRLSVGRVHGGAGWQSLSGSQVGSLMWGGVGWGLDAKILVTFIYILDEIQQVFFSLVEAFISLSWGALVVITGTG